MHDESNKRKWSNRWRALRAAMQRAVRAAVVLASVKSALVLAQDSPPRGSIQVRRWLADERQQLRPAERSTHRGREVQAGPIYIVANTGFSDDQRIAEQAQAGWEHAAKL